MDIAITIVMLVPVILAVALIVVVVRKNITERSPGDPMDITGAIPAVIILMVAIILIGAMTTSVTPYTWDDDDKTLTINQNVSGNSHEWDGYASQATSLVLTEKVNSVTGSAFTGFTSLEYVSIPESVDTIASSCFATSFEDPYGASITAVGPGEYAGLGDGTLYQCDPDIYTYSADKKSITGLSSDASGAVNLVIPTTRGGAQVTTISAYAFGSNTTIETVITMPDSALATVKQESFQNCTSLETVSIPSVKSMEFAAFKGDSALAYADIKGVTDIAGSAFYQCVALSEVRLDSVETIGNSAFISSAITSLDAPALKSIGISTFFGSASLSTVSLPSIETIGATAFQNCAGATSVTLGSSLASFETNSFASWTFKATDGTTTLEKTAANLAGHTFTGTASALVMQS